MEHATRSALAARPMTGPAAGFRISAALPFGGGGRLRLLTRRGGARASYR